MKNALKKTSSALVAGAMLISMSACSFGQKDDGGAKSQTQDGKIFNESTEMSIAIGSHNSWPYNKDWLMWKYFQEETGAKFIISAIPNADIDTKVNLMMASPDTLPDLLHVGNKLIADQHGPTGAFISLTQNEDKMPSMKAFLDGLPDGQGEKILNQRKSGDGEVYFAPVYGTDTVQNLRSWMYRKDIFEKNKISVPKTLDEVYTASKKLKAIYPKSYPLCFRNGLEQISIMGPAWKNDFAYNLYYDFEAKKWCYGAMEDTMKDIIAFFCKMVDEELVPLDFLTITTKSWEELASTDRGFIMPEYVTRIDFFNNIARKTNPQYTWEAMKPPEASAGTAGRIAKLNLDPTGYLVCNTKKEERIENAIKLLDWMYSDKGSQLLEWGKEGETYQVVDGKKKFIVGENESAQQKYGVATYGLLQRTEPEAYEALSSDALVKQCHKAYQYTEKNPNPMLWIALNSEEEQTRTELYDAIESYTNEMLSKFILKQEPMSKWDDFQKELKNMGIDRLIAVYDSAYKRATEK